MLLASCVKITFSEYIYVYKVETQSSRVIATFKLPDGRMATETIQRVASPTFGNWTYGWGSVSTKDSYYIKVKNDTTYGYIKVTVLRNNVVLKENIRRDSIILSN